MDTETAKAIQASSHWEEITKEIDREISYELNKMRSCSPEQLGTIQATINVLERIKVLPQAVIDRED